MTLFKYGKLTANSGLPLDWKIECDALTDEDWVNLGHIIGPKRSFGTVEGVPEGGLKFAEALRPYALPGRSLLIVDDVMTTGGSMERQRAGRQAHGLVLFARCRPAHWIDPIFQLGWHYQDG